MAKKPFNPAIPGYTPRSQRKEVEEVKLDFKPCCVCGKAIEDGYYARFSDGGVCSRTCMKVQDEKPRYPPPSALFLQQLEQSDGLDEGFEADTQVS